MEILKYLPFAFFIIIVIAVIIVIIKRSKNNGTHSFEVERDNSDDKDKETNALCRTLSPEELYQKACELEGDDGLISDWYRWKKFMKTAADKDYIPAVREWGIYNLGNDNALGLQLIIRAADAGDNKAVEKLYKLYYYGSHGGSPKIEKDIKKAANFIRVYADNGNAVAQRLLGEFWYYDLDNEEKALEWYMKAVDGGDPEAMAEAARIYSYREDYETEKRLLLKAAAQNYVKAEVDLGIFFHSLETDDIKPDFEQAMYWYKRACEHGGDTAACYVGEMYLNGEGTPKDEDRAYEWFKKAYEMGSIYGTYLYGKCFMEGIGVAQDKEKGIKLYTEAAEYDNDAQYALGLCYVDGNGVEKDLKKAVFYLKKAAEDRIDGEEAKNKLAELKSSGLI